MSLPSPVPRQIRRPGLVVAFVCAALAPLFFTGCATVDRQTGPAVTTLGPRTTVIPAKIVAHFFLVEARQIDGKTYRFMIDTGSTTTLVSPALASSLRQKEKPGQARTTNVRGANGEEVALPSITLKELILGDVRFARVPAQEYDFTELSVHVGQPIDGVLSYTLFRDTLCTLDYPNARLELAPLPFITPADPKPAAGVSTIAYDATQSTPLVTVRMGTESFVVLLDSGSDGTLSLNPAGLHPKFSQGPRSGNLSATLAGDRTQFVGRLAQDLTLGLHTVQTPVVDLTDQLSSIGGGLLSQFKLTFDQRRSTVTLARTASGPLQVPSRRSTGISFQRLPSYWKVLGLIPNTPADTLPLQTGDLCIRINGEPVTAWDFTRYTKLLNESGRITYTFVHANREQDYEVTVFDLVP